MVDHSRIVYLAWSARDNTTEFGHHDDFISREVVLLNGLPKNCLGDAVGVHIGGIECLDTGIVAIARKSANATWVDGDD